MKQDFTELGADSGLCVSSADKTSKCNVIGFLSQLQTRSFFFYVSPTYDREYEEDFEDETLEKRGCRLYT